MPPEQAPTKPGFPELIQPQEANVTEQAYESNVERYCAKAAEKEYVPVAAHEFPR